MFCRSLSLKSSLVVMKGAQDLSWVTQVALGVVVIIVVPVLLLVVLRRGVIGNLPRMTRGHLSFK